MEAKGQKGFTLIEVLVAITILAIGMLGMASLTIGILHTNKYSKDLTTATTLAQDKMEQIRMQGYVGTPSTDTTTTENSITGYPGFSRVTVIDVDSPMTGMKGVTVTVSWDSNAKSVKLDTILVS